MRNVNLTMIVAWAYNVQRPQVSGPDWINSQRYDVFAKAGRPAQDDKTRQMLQALLVERFKLVAHRESRPMEVMGMLVPNGGHKMTRSEIEGPTQSRQDPVRGTVVEGAPLAELANDMSGELEVPVVDMTGLKGRFTFNVQKYVSALRSRFVADPHPVNPKRG